MLPVMQIRNLVLSSREILSHDLLLPNHNLVSNMIHLVKYTRSVLTA